MLSSKQVRNRRSGLALHPRRVLHGLAAPDWRGEYAWGARACRHNDRGELRLQGAHRKVAAPSPTGKVEGARRKHLTGGLQTSYWPFAARMRRVATVVASIAAARHRRRRPPSPPPPAIAAAASRSLNELARAGVRAMLGFECRRAVCLPRSRARHSASLGQQHSSSGTARLLAPLVLAARSRRRGVDDPHTERKISRRPFVLHVQIESAKSGGRARHIRSAGSSRAGCASKPQPTCGWSRTRSG